jgi:hypothetical protein
MATTPPEKKRMTRLQEYLGYLYEPLIPTLWILYGVESNLPSTILVLGTLVIFIVLAAYAITKKRSETRVAIELAKVQAEVEKTRLFWERTRSPIEQERQQQQNWGKMLAYQLAASEFERSASDLSLAPEKRDFYREGARRLRDMAVGAH